MSATFGGGWASYRAKVISKDAGPAQLRESKLAFYAGAMELFVHLHAISATPSNPTQEDLDTNKLEAIYQEVLDYAAGAAGGQENLPHVPPEGPGRLPHRPATIEDPCENVAVSQATGWSVVDWRDSPSPSMPAECVGLLIHSPTFTRAMEVLVKAGEVPEGLGKADLMIRLKSARACDELAAALLERRDGVWPGRVHVCLGCGGTQCIEGRCHHGKQGGA